MTVYESVYESSQEASKAAGHASNEEADRMEIEGQEAQLELKFREIPYSVDTGEAEMIGVDYIARGAGNATAVDGAVKDAGKSQASQAPVGTIDPKKHSKAETKAMDDSSALSAEDDERTLTKYHFLIVSLMQGISQSLCPSLLVPMQSRCSIQEFSS